MHVGWWGSCNIMQPVGERSQTFFNFPYISLLSVGLPSTFSTKALQSPHACGVLAGLSHLQSQRHAASGRALLASCSLRCVTGDRCVTRSSKRLYERRTCHSPMDGFVGIAPSSIRDCLPGLGGRSSYNTVSWWQEAVGGPKQPLGGVLVWSMKTDLKLNQESNLGKLNIAQTCFLFSRKIPPSQKKGGYFTFGV